MAETEQTQVTHNKDGSIKITPPKNSKHHPRVTVLLEPDDLVREQVGGFVNFLREKAVVGLAVGFIVGQQAQTVVKQLVDSFVTPFLSLLFGQDLANKKVSFHGATTVTFTWGQFVYVLINFLFVLAFIYFIIKLFNLDKLDKPKK